NQVMSTAALIRKKSGSAVRAIQVTSLRVRPCSTNRLKPTGGVICAISTTRTMKMPNQIRSKPAACTVGSSTAIVSTTMVNALDKPSQDALLKAAAEAETRGWAASRKANTDTLEELKAAGMQIITPPAGLKADMKKVGE